MHIFQHITYDFPILLCGLHIFFLAKTRLKAYIGGFPSQNRDFEQFISLNIAYII